MSSSSLDEVRPTTETSLVRGSPRNCCKTSRPLSFGSFRSSRITAGVCDTSRPAYLPVANRNSSSSLPSRAITISVASFDCLSARIVSASSSGLSSTSRIIFSRIGALLHIDWRERALCQGAEQPSRRARPGKQKALALVAMMLAQEIQLGGGLNALGEHAQAERVRHRDDRLRDRCVAPAGGGAHHERAVDLQAIDRQPGQITQARVPRAEVVDRDLHAERLELFQDCDRTVPILDQHALGQLELEIAGLDPVGAQRLVDRSDEALA